MSGRAFNNTEPIKRKYIPIIVDEIIDIIKEDKILKYLINPFKYKGLGSTRQVLDESYLKGKSGDIDLLFLVSDNTKDIKHIIEQLKKYFLNYNDVLETKDFFTNIVSLKYRYWDKLLFGKVDEKYVQIDIMVARDQNEFEYLYFLKFWNDEDLSQNKIKGLHRTELIRSIIKTKGYSLGHDGCKRYILNNKFDDIKKLLTYIEQKRDKARSKISKDAWLEFWFFVKEHLNLAGFLNYIRDDEQKLNRLYINEFINIKKSPTTLKFIIDTLFEKTNVKNFEDVLIDFQDDKDKICLSEMLYRFNQFDKIYKSVEDEYIIYDYIQNLKNKKPSQYNKKIKRIFG